MANFIHAAVPVSTSLTISATGTAIATSQTITAAATLTASATSLASPTGTVQFLVNGTVSGAPVALSGGAATSASISFAAAGSYSITATYSGDALYVPSTSAPITTVVTAIPPGFSLSANPSSLTFTSGATTGNSVPITITSTNNYSGNVALSCSITTSSAAFQPTCAVSPSTSTLAANGSSTATVSIASTAAQAVLEVPVHELISLRSPVRLAAMSLTSTFALFGLFFLIRRRGALPLLALALLLFGGAVSLSGCAGGSPTPQRSSSGTYTVTVMGMGTGTGSLNASTATTTFTVNIQ